MQLSNQDILNLRMAYNYLGSVDPATAKPHFALPFKVSYAIARNHKALKAEIEALDETLEKVKEKQREFYAAKKETPPHPTSGVRDEYTKEWDVILDATVEIQDLFKVPESALANVAGIPPNVVAALMPMLQEDKPEPK